ncbi:MAG: hypothetical protein DWQ01_13590 [Planctomycetota bacterium]|nr:MAG: hypothetical protein DWQ01_13590 [Planctomycetota bacterium]
MQFIGLIQEQHPDRCALFMQWQQLKMPVWVDSLNRLGVQAVPLMWAIDEHGVVRATRPQWDWIEGEFLATDYPEPKSISTAIREEAAVSHFHAGRLDQAIDAWQAMLPHIHPAPDRGALLFRLGCAFRARHDSQNRRPGDFQKAIQAWTEALRLFPQNYIWRRRLQQYGPSLEKPYPFYPWIEEARAAIQARGQQPQPLRVEPEGAELVYPKRPQVGEEIPPADPQGKLARDTSPWVEVEWAIAPSPIKPGGRGRLYLFFEPSALKTALWNPPGGDLQWWWQPNPKLQFVRRSAATSLGQEETSRQRHVLEFEFQIEEEAFPPGENQPQELWLDGYGVYPLCLEVGGECVFLRRDLRLRIPLQL